MQQTDMIDVFFKQNDRELDESVLVVSKSIIMCIREILLECNLGHASHLLHIKNRQYVRTRGDEAFTHLWIQVSVNAIFEILKFICEKVDANPVFT